MQVLLRCAEGKALVHVYPVALHTAMKSTLLLCNTDCCIGTCRARPGFNPFGL